MNRPTYIMVFNGGHFMAAIH